MRGCKIKTTLLHSTTVRLGVGSVLQKCVCVCGCLACIELSAVLCGMGVQCASAVTSCSTVVLQTRGESKGKRSDS